jgi:hypothetical protein
MLKVRNALPLARWRSPQQGSGRAARLKDLKTGRYHRLGERQVTYGSR